MKYPLGWSEEKKKYDEYREDVGSEAEAIALIKAINDYIYHGGAVAEVPAWRRGKKAEDEAEGLTLDALGDHFIESRKTGAGLDGVKAEERTIEGYITCKNRIKPYYGDKRIKDITRKDIESAFVAMRSDGPANLGGRAYSSTTLQKTHSYLNLVFKWAVENDYIGQYENPMNEVKRPKSDTAERVPLTQQQAHELYSVLSERPLDPMRVGVLICLFCGLRQSEMLALRWSDYVDGRLEITKSLRRRKGQASFKATKTRESRIVPCPPALITVLSSWKEEQKRWYVLHDLDWSQDAPIVQSQSGDHVKQYAYMKWYRSASSSFPVPENFTLHGLRHTYVSLLDVEIGAARSTSKKMSGHKSDQAFNGYSHSNAEAMRRAASELGSLIAPDEGLSRCVNCQLWSESPVDATKGVCWADDGKPVVTELAHECDTGSFMMRVRN